MATITNSALYTLVAEELGLISGLETLSADDSDKISRRASKVRAWLIEEGNCYWADDAIPEAASLPLVMVIAGRCAEVFGRGAGSENPYPDAATGFQTLKEHVSKRSSREAIQSDYF